MMTKEEKKVPQGWDSGSDMDQKMAGAGSRANKLQVGRWMTAGFAFGLSLPALVWGLVVVFLACPGTMIHAM